MLTPPFNNKFSTVHALSAASGSENKQYVRVVPVALAPRQIQKPSSHRPHCPWWPVRASFASVKMRSSRNLQRGRTGPRALANCVFVRPTDPSSFIFHHVFGGNLGSPTDSGRAAGAAAARNEPRGGKRQSEIGKPSADASGGLA